VLTLAGMLYARSRGIPSWAAWPIVAAFLIAYPFYLFPGFPSVRERVNGVLLGYRQRAVAIGVPVFAVAAAVLPYLACCAGAVEFTFGGLARVIVAALAMSLWYVLLPASPITDVAYLCLWAAVLLIPRRKRRTRRTGPPALTRAGLALSLELTPADNNCIRYVSSKPCFSAGHSHEQAGNRHNHARL
jgi:hypothetical protein